MFSFNVRVEFNTIAAAAKRSPLYARAQEALDQQVLKDSDQYVPYAEGDLRKSGRVETPGLLTYNMPYARHQYYLADGAHYTTPGTGAKWFERAKAEKMREWIALIQKEIDQ